MPRANKASPEEPPLPEGRVRRKRTQYSVDEAALDAAIAEVMLSPDPTKVNRSAIARRHNVPLGTLRSRLNGHSSHRQGAQAQQVMPPPAERAVLDFLTWRFNKGDPATYAEATEAGNHMAAMYKVQGAGAAEGALGKQWLTRFRKRHPEIDQRGLLRPLVPLRKSMGGAAAEASADDGINELDAAAEEMREEQEAEQAIGAPQPAPQQPPAKRSSKTQ